MKYKSAIKQPQNNPQYFWEKITTKQIQSATTILFILFCLAPIFCSLMGKPWTNLLALITHYSFKINQVFLLWYTIIGIISTLLCIIMIHVLIHFIGRTHPFKKRNWLYTYWMPLFLCMLLIWSVISTFFAENKFLAIIGNDYSREGLLMFFFYAAFFISATQLNKGQIRIISEIIVAVCAITGILVLTQGRIFPGLFYLHEDKRATVFQHYNHYGYYLAVCIPLIFGMCLNDTYNKPLFRVLRMIEFWLILNAAAFNSCRGSFVAYFLVIICWNIYIFILHKEKKKRLLFLDTIFIATILFLNTNSYLIGRMCGLFREVTVLLHETKKAELMDRIGSERGILWRYAIKFSFINPIFGLGPANLGPLYENLGINNRSPHNDILLIIANMGYPAGIMYLTALGGHLRNFLRSIVKMDIMEITVFAVVGSYLISSLVGVSVYYTAPYYFMFLGFSYRICQKYTSSNL